MPATYYDVEGMGTWEYDVDADAVSMLLSACAIVPPTLPTQPAIRLTQPTDQDVPNGVSNGFGRGKILEKTEHRDYFLKRELRAAGLNSYSNAKIEHSWKQSFNPIKKDDAERYSDVNKKLIKCSEEITFKRKKRSVANANSSNLLSSHLNGDVYNSSEDGQSSYSDSSTMTPFSDKSSNYMDAENGHSPGLDSGKESDFQLDSDLESIVSSSTLRIDAPEFLPKFSNALPVAEYFDMEPALDESATALTEASPVKGAALDDSGILQTQTALGESDILLTQESPAMENVALEEAWAGKYLHTDVSKWHPRRNQNALLAALEVNRSPIHLCSPEEFLVHKPKGDSLSENVTTKPSTAPDDSKLEDSVEHLNDRRVLVNKQSEVGNLSVLTLNEYSCQMSYVSLGNESSFKETDVEGAVEASKITPEDYLPAVDCRNTDSDEFLLSEAAGGAAGPQQNYNVMDDPTVDYATKKLISELVSELVTTPEADSGKNVPCTKKPVKSRFTKYSERTMVKPEIPTRNPCFLTPTDFVVNQTDFPPLI